MPVNKKDIIPEHYLPKLKKSFQPTEDLMSALCKRRHLKVLFALEENDDEQMRFSEIGNLSGFSSGVCGAASCFGVGVERAECDTNQFVALFQKQNGRHCAVDATAHSH